MSDDAASRAGSALTEGLGLVPAAWMGPVGQTMENAIYEAWAPRYPDDAKHFVPLYGRAALDAAVAAERERWRAWLALRAAQVAAVSPAARTALQSAADEFEA